MPEVSIIIPVYNTEKYLRDCLQSVKDQSYTDFEVLCVNDGSIDSSGEIIDEFCQDDSRFLHIKQENQGVSVARNHALDIAKGKYIYFSDSDDILHTQLITICIFFIKNHNADFVSFRHQRFPENETPIQSDIIIEDIKFESTSDPVKYIWTKKTKNPFKLKEFPWGKFFRQDFIGNNRFISGITYEDVPFSINLLKDAEKVILLETKLYFYRTNPYSITQNFKLCNVTDRQKGLVNILDSYKGHPRDDTLKKKLSRHLLKQFEQINQQIPFLKKFKYYKEFELGLIAIQPFGLLQKRYIKRRYLYIYLAMIWRRKLILYIQNLFKLNNKVT